MKKYNIYTREYEPYSIPEHWICPLYSNNMNEVVNCSSCGKLILFGNGFTSRLIHSDKGFGYSVCEECHDKEVKEEMELFTKEKEKTDNE